MNIDRPALKTRAKELIRSAEPKPVLVGLVYLLIIIVISVLSARLIGISTQDYQRLMTYYNSGNYDYVANYAMTLMPSTSDQLINLALELVESLVGAGFIIFLLNTIRQTGASFGNLFDGFAMFLKIIWLEILTGLLVFLWSLLLVIPGIIAAYRYRLALYILLDNPELSAMDCIRESKRLMAGHKWELFVFDLSFLGWMILSAIPIVGYLVLVWLLPYRGLSYALYYEARREADGAPLPGSTQTPPWEG